MKALSHSIRIVGLIPLLAGTAAAQDKLYFTHYKYNDPKLQVMNLDGSNVQDLFDPNYPFPSADWLPNGLALDEPAGKIYWDHGSTPGRIRRANLDGSNQELLVSGLKISRGVSLDLVDGRMYWAASPAEGNAGGLIQRANLDGSNVETVYYDPDYDPTWSKISRPTVDDVNGYVYFGSNGVIKRANLDGPPFGYHTVATGGSTITRIQLDVANNHLYWIDSNTISDALVRVNLDNTGFTVIVDATPNSTESSGLIDVALDLVGGKAYWADEIGTKGIFRANLDGSDIEMIHASPSDYNASGLILNTNTPQPILDCNGNSIRDKDDVDSGYSEDCNGNGIPDECEDNPCEPPVYLLDQGFDPEGGRRQLGGAPENQRWIIFQPFDVPPEGWNIGALEINGVTWNYHPDGFTATIFPDDGTDYPDESQPLASADALLRYAAVWETLPLSTTLPQGRHWVRLTANGDNVYTASVSVGTSGLNSFSRSGLGNDFFNRPPIALRILPGEICVGDLDGDDDTDQGDLGILLSDWGCTGGDCVGDLSGDGNTDQVDLGILLADWNCGVNP